MTVLCILHIVLYTITVSRIAFSATLHLTGNTNDGERKATALWIVSREMGSDTSVRFFSIGCSSSAGTSLRSEVG